MPTKTSPGLKAEARIEISEKEEDVDERDGDTRVATGWRPAVVIAVALASVVISDAGAARAG